MPTPSGDNKPRFHTLIPAATTRTNRPRSSVVVAKPTSNHQSVKSTKKTSSTTQTDATAYPKAGSSFQTSPRQDESGMRQDYTRAVNFINSCHKFVNSLIEIRGDASTGDKNKFFLPKVTNFVPLFTWLTNGEQQQQPVATTPAKEEQPKRTRHRKKLVDGGGGASQIEKDLKDMLQGHLGEFLNNIQSNLTTIVTDKAKVERDVSKTKARMVTTIQSFEYRGKSQTRHEYPARPSSPPPSVLLPLPPPSTENVPDVERSSSPPQFPNFNEETTAVEPFNSSAMLCDNSSSSSLSCSLSHSQLSDSSDIKSDADIRDELVDC